jgi:hypothetical protein
MAIAGGEALLFGLRPRHQWSRNPGGGRNARHWTIAIDLFNSRLSFDPHGLGDSTVDWVIPTDKVEEQAKLQRATIARPGEKLRSRLRKFLMQLRHAA